MHSEMILQLVIVLASVLLVLVLAVCGWVAIVGSSCVEEKQEESIPPKQSACPECIVINLGTYDKIGYPTGCRMCGTLWVQHKEKEEV